MTTTHILLFAVVMVGVMVVMRSTRNRWRASQSGPRQSVKERYEQLGQDRATLRDVDQVMTELDRLARQVHGRLDTQFAKLEAVIRDADERIEKLSRLVREAEGGPALDVTVSDELGHPRSPASATIACAPSGRAAPSESDSPAAENVRTRIQRMARNGQSAEDIAAALNHPVGEVSLILSLEKTLQSAKRLSAAGEKSPSPQAAAAVRS